MPAGCSLKRTRDQRDAAVANQTRARNPSSALPNQSTPAPSRGAKAKRGEARAQKVRGDLEYGIVLGRERGGHPTKGPKPDLKRPWWGKKGITSRKKPPPSGGVSGAKKPPSAKRPNLLEPEKRGSRPIKEGFAPDERAGSRMREPQRGHAEQGRDRSLAYRR